MIDTRMAEIPRKSRCAGESHGIPAGRVMPNSASKTTSALQYSWSTSTTLARHALALSFAFPAHTALRLLTLGVLDGFVDGQNQARGFRGSTQGTLFDDDWLPDVVLECVGDRAIDAIHADPAALRS